MTTKWNIDTSHSGIDFAIRHMVFAKVRGRFGKWSGTVQLAGDLVGSSVEAEIEAASIDTGTADRDAHLKAADFFDVEKYPKLVFKSTRIERDGDDKLKVHGDLTIRDVTRAVVLDAEFGGRGKDPWGNERIGVSAKTSIERRDFGLEWNQVLEAGGVLVGERVDIEIGVEAVKAPE